jgi:hypothetical protein
MRLAEPVDRAGVTAMARARCAWMDERGLPAWWDAIDGMAEQCRNHHGDVWVLDDPELGIIGQVLVQRQGPPFGWTEDERGQDALYLSGSITRPDVARPGAPRPGALMAWWAVDRAARTGVPFVRRHCQDERVAEYNRTRQGFALVRRERRTHAELFMMERAAELLYLAPWLRGSGTP